MRAAHGWYEEKVPGLGARFVTAVERQARSLEELPEKYRKAYGDIHRCSVPRFPFELYYKIEEQRVVVLVVHAVRQDSAKLVEKFQR
jgi:plasmid stabilization system protein ParE